MNEIRIPLKKSKLIFGTFTSLILTFLHLTIFIFSIKNINQTNFDIINIISLFGTLTFGILAYIGLKRYFSSKYCLLINERGIVENYSINNIGLIKWNDIIEISAKEIELPNMKTTKLIIIKTNNWEKYTERGNRIMKFIMKLNLKKYGTPFIINVTNLDYDFDKIRELLETKIKNKIMPNG